MKTRIKFFIGIASLIISIGGAFGQQQPLYSQYMFNGLSINPAYAGTRDAVDISALARWQWVGVEGAPKSSTISAHSPIPNKNIGVGLTISRDEVAIYRQTNLFAAYAYRIPVALGHYLSLGLQGGFTSFRGDYNDVYTLTPDVTFQEQYAQFLPNAGLGVFYYNSLFYAGLSAPMMIKNKIRNGDTEIYSQQRHFFFTSGMVINLNDHIKAKPNVLVKMVDGSPLSVDYNLNFLIQKLVWIGFSVRPPESVIFIGELNVSSRFRIGYAYDYIMNESLRTATSSTHELMINYSIGLQKRGVTNPRYF